MEYYIYVYICYTCLNSSSGQPTDGSTCMHYDSGNFRSMFTKRTLLQIKKGKKKKKGMSLTCVMFRIMLSHSSLRSIYGHKIDAFPALILFF